jgi:peptide/nickel transport system substrate-binding protein
MEMLTMTRVYRATAIGMMLCLALAACAPAPATPTGGQASDMPSASGPKRFTAATRGNPHTVYQKLNPRSNIPGIDALERLVSTGLTVPTPDGAARMARLAETAPTVENGLWKLLPDGTMEMRWTIRPGAVWQDGAPFTADDLVFTAMVVRDKSLPIFGHAAYDSLGTVEALDSRTVVATWTKPYIQADQLFSFEIALPVAKHKLEEAYNTDREHFIDHPYWSTEFVGLGPYKIKRWEPGSHLVFEANDRYIAGRPKIDEVTVKFIPDPNTLAANLLTGEVDMPWGGRIDIEWAQHVAGQWQFGKLETGLASMLQIFAQHVNPTPAIVGNVEFKRAMLHALDRQTMADTLQPGNVPLGHSFLSPLEPEWAFLESAIVRYTYDPARSLQLLENLGYTRGADGKLQDRSGQKLAFQIRTSQGDVTQEKGMFASADDWARLGVEVERFLVPPQRASDAEFRATYPAFDLKRQAGTMDYAKSFHSRGIALPANNYLVSGNNSRYSRPEMDLAIDRYFTTVPWEQRMEVGRQIVNMLSDDVGWIGLYHLVAPGLIPSRVSGMPAAKTEAGQLDAIHEWDVRG